MAGVEVEVEVGHGAVGGGGGGGGGVVVGAAATGETKGLLLNVLQRFRALHVTVYCEGIGVANNDLKVG